MRFGVWYPKFLPVIRKYVLGKTVWDLGFGRYDSEPTQIMQLGASEVIGVDKRWDIFRAASQPPPQPGISLRGETFLGARETLEGRADVALIAWPNNTPTPGLATLLERADVVIYIGCNFGGTSCGSRGLWKHLFERQVLENIEGLRNDLTVYGRWTRTKDSPRTRDERSLAEWIDSSPFPQFSLFGGLNGR